MKKMNPSIKLTPVRFKTDADIEQQIHLEMNDGNKLPMEYGLAWVDFVDEGITLVEVRKKDNRQHLVYPCKTADGKALNKCKSITRNPKKNMKRDCWHSSISVKGGGIFGKSISHCKGKHLILAGGEEKVMAAKKAGFLSICLSTGEKAPSEAQLKFIVESEPSSITVVYDADVAGTNGAKKAAQALFEAGIKEVRIVNWPEDLKKGYDLNDELKANGPAGVHKVITNAVPFVPDEKKKQKEPMKHLTDTFNAEVMADLVKGKLVYIVNRGFFTYQGGVWVKDEEELIAMSLAKQTARHINETPELHGKNKRQAINIENHSKLKAMLELVRDIDGVRLSSEGLNTDPWLLNCTNGTVDLKTGKLKDHDPNDFMTGKTNTPWTPKAKCPKWITFLDSIFDGDNELVAYTQRILGYSLSGDTSEQCFFIFMGNGANGKSTLIEAITHILGDYAKQMNGNSLLSSPANSSSTHNSHLCQLDGARFVAAVETDRERRICEALVKSITGQDSIQVREIYQKAYTMLPRLKLFLATNHFPEVRGVDHGFWRRVFVIPFNHCFKENECVKNYTQRLLEEQEGILQWMHKGFLEWQKTESLSPPEAVLEATKEYRKDSDILWEFLDVCCELNKEACSTAKELYAAYVNWCEANAEEPVNKRTFGKLLREHGFKKARTSTSRMWKGIALKDSGYNPQFESVLNPMDIPSFGDTSWKPKSKTKPRKGEKRKRRKIVLPSSRKKESAA